jgi:2-polyprenyl-3-methyl-5-hydroxy-6-metoxy-1,4-benzoquinol methylase
MKSRVDLVKTFFDKPERYLRTDFNLRIRADVVKGFVGDVLFESILDIGCGDGTISLPLLSHNNHLTLLDLSDAMLSIASTYIPSELSENVKIINGDFMNSQLSLHSYDLILCLGVLAHIDSPDDCIKKMISLLKPNGSIIVQNTDSLHPMGFLFNIYSKLQSFLSGRIYSLNHIRSSRVIEIFNNNQFVISGVYRYNLPVPGMARLFSNNFLYKFIRKIFGTHDNNHLVWLGSEHIIHFKKT